MLEYDYLYFYHHVIMAYEKTFQGLISLYNTNKISSEEFATLQIKNFERYQTKREQFAQEMWGEKWEEHLKSCEEQIFQDRS